jgi:hypothetical protein
MRTRPQAIKKIICRGKKAQSITEIATFGSLLILALSFLVRYGMIYNHQQEAQMEVFRRALNESYYGKHSGLNLGQSLTLVKDVTLPEPSDRFGLSNKVTVGAAADIVWTNESQQGINASDYVPGNTTASKTEKLPRIDYTFNPQLGAGSKTKSYTTANFITDQVVYNIPLYVLGQEYNITPSQTKIVQNNDTEEKQVKVLLQGTSNCASSYCPTDILTLADLDHDGKKEEQIIEPVGNPGQQLAVAKYIDYQKGDIDADMLQLDLTSSDPNKRVTPDNVQGLLQDLDTQVARDESLTLKETSKETISTSQSSGGETITHKIRPRGDENNVASPETFPFTFEPKTKSQTWTTPK